MTDPQPFHDDLDDTRAWIQTVDESVFTAIRFFEHTELRRRLAVAAGPTAAPGGTGLRHVRRLCEWAEDHVVLVAPDEPDSNPHPGIVRVRGILEAVPGWYLLRDTVAGDIADWVTVIEPDRDRIVYDEDAVAKYEETLRRWNFQRSGDTAVGATLLTRRQGARPPLPDLDGVAAILASPHRAADIAVALVDAGWRQIAVSFEQPIGDWGRFTADDASENDEGTQGRTA